MTRLWPDGQPITVEPAAQQGSESSPGQGPGQKPGVWPSQFTWLGRRHQVTEITKTWRVDVDWWRDRVWRAYFKLRTDSGLLVIIFQDLLTRNWYLQRLYD
jgi:hypothetical protein